jgi:hypothetical protein
VSLSPNAPAFTSTQASISIAMPGTYKVTLARGTSTCSTLITIGASPCNTIADPATRTCTTSALTGVADEAANRLTDLAAGDVVQAGDFNITITEVTGTSSGWNGKGYVTVPYLNSKVNIVLQNAVFNDCYQLTNANSSSEQPTVFTAYDPSWGSMVDMDKFIDQMNVLLDNINSWVDKFQGTQDDIDAATTYIDELKYLGESIKNDLDYSTADKADIQSKIDEEIGNLQCAISDAQNKGSRIDASMATGVCLVNVKTGANNLQKSVWEPILKLLLCDEKSTAPYTADGKTGIVPMCIWQDAFLQK